jgi:arylsulfatase A-like enzyme
LKRPFLGYFHYLPPHSPYNTRKEFVDRFLEDGLKIITDKPANPYFKKNKDETLNMGFLNNQIQKYDEYILYADSELGRLFDSLEQSGILDNTTVIFTSDHGELFERGFFGHRNPVMYEGLTRIPLLILDPVIKTRRDVFTSTSSTDVLPTLLKIHGKAIPEWAEGKPLPLYSNSPVDPERNIYSVEATDSQRTGPLGPATVMLVKGKYKLTYCLGYQKRKSDAPYFELYDLENDPEELNNIYSEDSSIAQDLRNEVISKVNKVDKPYQ